MSPRFCIAANGDREIVNHAEALAVLREGVMKSAADIDADTVAERALGRQDRAARVQQEGIHDLRRVRNLHLQLFPRAESAFHQLVDVMRRMHQGDVRLAGGLRRDEVALVRGPLLQQAFANPEKLVGAKNVFPDRQIVLLAIDQFEGQHGPAFPISPNSRF